MSELKYWLWLTLKKGLSNRKITFLLDHFGTPEKVFYASGEALGALSELLPRERKLIQDKDMQKVYRVVAICKKKNIKILTFDSPYYPKTLASVYDPPYVLYARYRERIDLNEHATIAVVGTRKSTSYGNSAARALGKTLTENGMTVVSGMAEGIDTHAALGALSAGGKTVAVLGCGVDVCYPPENKKLMDKIIDRGLVLSEYPPGSPPSSKHFPVRNRIISGLSLGTIVVEAPKRSGALITARIAGEQNREVFSVPGDITRKKSVGSNLLLQEGAKPVLSAEDVLCEFRDVYGDLLEKNRTVPGGSFAELSDLVTEEPEKKAQKPKKKQAAPPMQPVPAASPAIPENLDETEKAILSLLSREMKHIDELAEQGFSLQALTATLTMLEMKGLIRAHPGKHYTINL